MSYLQKITSCNTADFSDFFPFYAGEQRVGWIHHDFSGYLREYPDVFAFDDERICFAHPVKTFEQRTESMRTVISTLVKNGHIKQHYGEVYPASTDHRDKPLFLLDRAAASCFGTRTYGQHLNGFVRKGKNIHMWIGRRSRHRGFYPGRLDQMVAGGLPYRVRLEDNLRKECHEEAGIPPGLAGEAVAVGCLSCCYQNPRGIKPETLYCYDLELPESFRPQCQDGEVEAFMLMPIDEVAVLVRETDEFKLNCNLVIIDFLIRHGIMGPDEPDYELLVRGLHQ